MLCGRDIRETTNGIMNALFSDDLFSQFNFYGRGDNREIGALKVSRIVIGTLILIIRSIAIIIIEMIVTTNSKRLYLWDG